MFFSVIYVVFIILLAVVFLLAAMFFTHVVKNDEIRGRAFRLLGHLGLFWYAAWSGALRGAMANEDKGDKVILLILVIGGFCGYQAVRAGVKHPWDMRQFKLREYLYSILASVAIFFITAFFPEFSRSGPIASFFHLVVMIDKAPIFGFLIRFVAAALFGGLFGFGALAVIVAVVRNVRWGLGRA